MNLSKVVVASRHVTMVFTVNLFSNGERLFLVFFSLTVLTKGTINISEVVVAHSYMTMVSTVIFFCKEGQRRLIALFSLTVLTKVTVNISQVVVTCRYVFMVFAVSLFSNGERPFMVFPCLGILANGTIYIAVYVEMI